ncbi:hypothetical protein F383_15201 [Gossypium arboreum]|uniref:Uncharacterized protein n=1 Tax=Gossypium arboreum TaxID=29729 RepID=A0A0B0NBE4_GOSAR|nr:hypothetical protein F383_15201 [Gossypium arboreum]
MAFFGSHQRCHQLHYRFYFLGV